MRSEQCRDSTVCQRGTMSVIGSLVAVVLVKLCISSHQYGVQVTMFRPSRDCYSKRNPQTSDKLTESFVRSFLECATLCGSFSGQIPHSERIRPLYLCERRGSGDASCAYHRQTCVIPKQFTSSRKEHKCKSGQVCETTGSSCKEIRKSGSGSKEYTVLVKFSSKTLTIFCDMQPTKTVTFLQTASLRNISDLEQFYDNNTQVVLRHRWVDGRQYDSILEQIQSLPAIPLTITSLTPDGYPKPINTVLGEYIYLRFQPNVYLMSVNGFRANGHDFKFSNSDMSRNSYFAFYPNIAKRQSSSSMNFTDGLIDVMGWIKSSRKVRASVLLPKDYFYVTEIHFGGNGGLTTSTLWSYVTGTSLGLIQTL